MEENLNELIKLKEIQNRVITLRTEVPSMYNKLLRKECNNSIENLLSRKICVEEKTLIMPKIQKFNTESIKTQPTILLNEINQHCDNAMRCLPYIRKN